MKRLSPASVLGALGQVGVQLGSGMSRGIARVATPVVHPWMRQRPQRVRDLVSQLDGHLARLDEARRRTEPLCPGLGRDPAAESPAAPLDGQPQTHPLEDLRTALVLTRDAFETLAADLERHVDGLDAAIARLGTAGLDRTQIWAVRREVREHTDALSGADVECRRALEAATRLVPDGDVLARLAVPDVGVAPGPSDAPAGVVAEPSDAGVLGEPADARSLRVQLRTVDSQRVADVLSARPRLAEALVAAGSQDLKLLPPGIGESWLGLGRSGIDAAGRLTTVETRRAHLDAAGDLAVTAALLWPAVFAPLDGAPPQARIAANRLVLRAELGRARRADVELEMRAIARRVTDGRVWWRPAHAAALRAWLTRDVVTSYVTTTRVDLPGLLRADLRVRILLYQGLLYDPVVGSAAGVRVESSIAGSRRAPGRRRLLLFEPAGPGRLAELWGVLDARTRAVAVFVPGTGTAVRGFHLPTQVARDLAEASDADAGAWAEDQAGTAVVAWMGADFPLAIGSHAPFARFALAAAPALRDFVAGLPVPEHAPRTVLGHSYGGTMVGAAERVGLQADRIVHVASPGAGPGVRSVADYPAVDPLGRPRRPMRFTLTAPGDPIGWAQRFEAPWELLPKQVADWLRARLAGLSLGVDPARLAGVHVLEAGVWEIDGPGHRAGDVLAGPAAHAAVTARGTQAFRRLVEVVGAPL